MESDIVFVELCYHVRDICESVINIETQPLLSLRQRKH